MTFKNKYEERTERVSIRLPLHLKNQIWKSAKVNRITATDVLVTIMTEYFSDRGPAEQWVPGTTHMDPKKAKLSIARAVEARAARTARAAAARAAKAAAAATELAREAAREKDVFA